MKRFITSAFLGLLLAGCSHAGASDAQDASSSHTQLEGTWGNTSAQPVYFKSISFDGNTATFKFYTNASHQSHDTTKPLVATFTVDPDFHANLDLNIYLGLRGGSGYDMGFTDPLSNAISYTVSGDGSTLTLDYRDNGPKEQTFKKV